MFQSCFPCSSSVKEENEKGRHLIPGTNLEFKVKYRVKDVDIQPLSGESVFLETKYQTLLEDFPSRDTYPLYIQVYESGTPLGIMQAQSTLVKGADSLNIDAREKGFWNNTKNMFYRAYNRRWLVIGNLLLTGNFGMRFKGKTSRESFVILDMVVQHALPVIESEQGHKHTFLFYKDFSEEQAGQSEALRQRNFFELKSEPSMVMNIPSDWETFDDYLGAMTSKYRVRVRRAYKKGKELERKDLSLEEITQHKERIHELYQKISLTVDFNLVNLHPDYFMQLKKRFGDDFRLVAYFLNGEMIGFCTTIKDYHETHAHFLGLDQQYNAQYQLYLNILYDIVKIGIENQSHMIDFARTAAEIKSSVGAVPKETFLYIRHRNSFFNRFVAGIVNSLQDDKKPVYRSPFKSKGGAASEASAAGNNA